MDAYCDPDLHAGEKVEASYFVKVADRQQGDSANPSSRYFPRQSDMMTSTMFAVCDEGDHLHYAIGRMMETGDVIVTRIDR